MFKLPSQWFSNSDNFASQRTFAIFGSISVCHNWGSGYRPWHLMGKRPGMLLNLVQCTERRLLPASIMKNYPVQNVSTAEVGKPCFILMILLFGIYL